MTEYGFYVVSDQFFVDFPDSYLKGNKVEKRPHYFAIQDRKTGLYWFIPMSSKVEKYRAIIQKREENHHPCDILHIARLDNGKESVFLIQDMFPISEEYVARKYTIAGNHLRVTSERLAGTVAKKARRVLGMIKRNVKFLPTQPDVLKIEKELLARKSNQSK